MGKRQAPNFLVLVLFYYYTGKFGPLSLPLVRVGWLSCRPVALAAYRLGRLWLKCCTA